MANQFQRAKPTVPILILSVFLKTIAVLALLMSLAFLILPSVRWSASGYVSGRNGDIFTPENATILAFFIVNLTLGILSFLTARGLKNRPFWARWMPLAVAAVATTVILFLKSFALLFSICLPLLTLALLTAFLPSSRAYFSASPNHEPILNVTKEKSSAAAFLKLAPWLLLGTGVLFFIFDGILASKKISELCYKFPAGSSSVEFLREGVNVDVDKLRFWNDEKQISGSWDNDTPELKSTLFAQYALLESGRAYALNFQFFIRRVSCQIEFIDKKVIKSSIVRFD